MNVITVASVQTETLMLLSTWKTMCISRWSSHRFQACGENKVTDCGR
ncbi:MAG: hypothetical protein WBA93_26065 [Microcoleaceae cyanobacterium]